MNDQEYIITNEELHRLIVDLQKKLDRQQEITKELQSYILKYFGLPVAHPMNDNSDINMIPFTDENYTWSTGNGATYGNSG